MPEYLFCARTKYDDDLLNTRQSEIGFIHSNETSDGKCENARRGVFE